MDKIFNKVSDKNVAVTKIYTKSNDSYAYSDSTFTNKIPEADLGDLFIKGVIVVDATATYKPISYSVMRGVGIMTYVKANTATATKTTATDPVLVCLYSKEYSST